MIKKIMIAMAMLVTMLIPMSVAAPASASHIAGCNSEVQLRADTWGINTAYFIYGPRIPDGRRIRLVATAGYWFCPNGSGVNKVKVKWVEYCHTHIDDPHFTFDGVKFNPFFFDDDTDSNPPTTYVPDDGTMQNCRRDDITNEYWLRMPQSPGWTVTSWIIRDYGNPDSERIFEWNGSKVKYFHPDQDAALTGWF